MQQKVSHLRSYLESVGADGYLVDDSSDSKNQHYLSGYYSSDPFITLVTPRDIHLLFWGMDYFSAQDESSADHLHRHSDYGYDGYGSSEEQHRVIGNFLSEHEIDRVAVPGRFPVSTSDALESKGFTVIRENQNVVETDRAIKTSVEIERITETQRIAEAGLQEAENMLEQANVDDGVLFVDGEPLTAEMLGKTIQLALFERGALLNEPTVATGERPFGAFDGPITEGQSIQIDVAPRHLSNGYCSDMARTFVRGEPDPILIERYETVEHALEYTLGHVKPGVSGEEIHKILCSFFEERGYSTPRTANGIDEKSGVPHVMGHGVGLDVHERPLCVPEGDTLCEGNVIALEPALYEPGRGGIILEDMVRVTSDGYEPITEYPREFIAN
ncbi:M24 family metallopeptidase [Natrialbaceae archaeon A-CW2]